jgi:rhodanese-related sulfurtransferase
MVNWSKYFLRSVLMKKQSLAMLLFLIPSCTWWQTKSEPTSGLIIVNVLDKEYHDDCHIKGSIHVTVDDLEKKAASWDKNSEIVFYCTNFYCTSSGWAADQATKMGFKHVYAYEGGMAEWYQKGYPVEGQCKKAYLTKKITPFDDEEESKGYTVITAGELYAKMMANELVEELEDVEDAIKKLVVAEKARIKKDVA